MLGQNTQSSTFTYDIDTIPDTFNKNKFAKICASMSIHKSCVSLFKFIIAAMEEKTNSLKLKMELETTDTAELKSTNALVDCGATGEFID